MALYAVRTTYYLDQIIAAETAEQAMLKAEDTQPPAEVTEGLGLIEIDRTADNEPLSEWHGSLEGAPELIHG